MEDHLSNITVMISGSYQVLQKYKRWVRRVSRLHLANRLINTSRTFKSDITHVPRSTQFPRAHGIQPEHIFYKAAHNYT